MCIRDSVGTHKDQLDSNMARNQIVNVDQQLQRIIRSTSHFKDLVEFASEHPSQLMFAVNNFSKDDSDFKCIRSAVKRVVIRDSLQMTSPAHWLIYSLALRKLTSPVITYAHSLEVAKQCGISNPEELNEALHFIHSKMGLIRYFPYEDVKDLVFIHPQFLFDRVTELIVDTFTFEKVGLFSMEEFKRKGIFSVAEFKRISMRNQSFITPFQFGKLLERLRIAAQFKIDNEEKYFFPCALAHARESVEDQVAYSTPVPPLLISFKCGYCPKGVAGALIKYLIANEMESSSPWILLTDEIFKNQISFSVGPYDTVIIKVLPTHFEITCIPDPQFDKREDQPVKETCTEVRKAIDSGMQQILIDLNYIKTQHLLTFPCQAVGCEGVHPAQILFNKGYPSCLMCKITNKRFKLPPRSHWWDLTQNSTKSQQELVQSSSKTQHTQLTEQHKSVLLNQLTKHSTRWREIGLPLGFLPTELDNIQDRPLLLSRAPTSWLRAMLSEWLQWAPGDSRGSTSFATLEGLKTALGKAGLGAAAHDLSVQTHI